MELIQLRMELMAELDLLPTLGDKIRLEDFKVYRFTNLKFMSEVSETCN